MYFSYIFIAPFELHRFWVYVYCLVFLCFDFVQMVRFGHALPLLLANDVNKTGGYHYSICRTMFGRMTWFVQFVEIPLNIPIQTTFIYFNQCFTYSWYLAVDMQLFFIGPAIIYLIYHFKTKAICALMVLIFGCIAYTVDVYVKYNLRTLWVFLILFENKLLTRQHFFPNNHSLIHILFKTITICAGFIGDHLRITRVNSDFHRGWLRWLLATLFLKLKIN